MRDLRHLPDSFWKEKLTSEAYRVLREKGTEAPFSGDLFGNKKSGVYRCAACGTPLFSSDDKFDSGTGWPSFTRPTRENDIEHAPDNALGISRTEVLCKTCGGHLGHVFDDGPKERGGRRYCINSCALSFSPEPQS